jgi:hypothetical protein
MMANNDWINIRQGRHNKLKNTSSTYKQPFYIKLSNQYSSLPQFAADPPLDNLPTTQPVLNPTPIPSTSKHKAQCKALACKIKCLRLLAEEAMLDQRITWAEDEAAAREVVLTLDRPWEGRYCGAPTVIHHEGRYQLYYRGLPDVRAKTGPGTWDEKDVVTWKTQGVCCYAVSTDGITFERPALGIHAIEGDSRNNITLAGEGAASLAPFLDLNPDAIP